MLVVSCIFTFALIYIDFKGESIFMLVILYLGFLLFSFGIVYSMLLLLRRKPLLTVTEKQIIIYNVFRKPKSIDFEEVTLFFMIDMRHHGIKTSEYICIIMKNPKERTNMMDRISSELFPASSNVHYSIQTDVLNVKTKALLELLRSRIRPYCLLE